MLYLVEYPLYHKLFKLVSELPCEITSFHREPTN